MKKEDQYPLFCLFIYILAFIIGAINPLYPQDWFLESILALIIIPILIFTYSKFRFSNTSYTLILIFSILQVTGSHYTYAETPIGFWLKDLFDFSRNHYDRIVHFAWGLLLYLPTLELYQKLSNNKMKTLFNYSMPLFILVALGGIFEAIESLVALVVAPNLGNAYLGAQGDIWDAQKDITLKIVGSLLAMLYLYKTRK